MRKVSIFFLMAVLAALVGCGPEQQSEAVRPALDREEALKETQFLHLVAGRYRGEWISAAGNTYPFGMELRIEIERVPYEGEGGEGRRYIEIPRAGGQLYLYSRLDDPETPENEEVVGGFTWVIIWGTYQPGADLETGDLKLKVIGPDGRQVDLDAKYDRGQLSGRFNVRDGVSRFSVRRDATSHQ